jgi:hypothetical protein
LLEFIYCSSMIYPARNFHLVRGFPS